MAYQSPTRLDHPGLKPRQESGAPSFPATPAFHEVGHEPLDGLPGTARAIDDAGGGLGDAAQQGQGGHRLTAAGLTDDVQRFDLPQRKTDTIYRLGCAPAVEKVGVEIFNF